MRFTHWEQPSSSGATDEILSRVALVHCSRINSIHVRRFFESCLHEKDFLSICNYEPDYGSISVYDAIQVRQICAFFSKRADRTEPGHNKRLAAVKTFIEAEELCFKTNDILVKKRRGEFYFPAGVESVLHRAQQKIAFILGDIPLLEDLKLRFGPGATTQVKKRKASAKSKLSQTFACSEDLLPMAQACLEELQGWIFPLHGVDGEDTASVTLEIHRGKLSFVPKSFKTDRSIVVEPSLNSMFQMGIGDYISDRLRMAGVNLRDQTLNQRMALEGSLTGALATLDLSSASDTIAYELIYELLPIDWALWLSHFRSGKVMAEGVELKLQKFSSMGNGFTFPLESLIFYALAYASTSEDECEKVSVYGDDIIVPVAAYPLLTEVLRCVGFLVNASKSFCSGPFRESCGADYLKGINIRPSYIKDVLHTFDLFRLHNQYVRRDDHECAQILLEYVDPSLYRYGPDGYGDGHLIKDVPLAPHQRRRGWSGYVFESYTFRPKKDFRVLPGDRVYPIYSSYVRSKALARDVLFSRGIPSGDDKRLLDMDNLPIHEYSRDGRLGVSIPGVRGHNLVKIYVLG